MAKNNGKINLGNKQVDQQSFIKEVEFIKQVETEFGVKATDNVIIRTEEPIVKVVQDKFVPTVGATIKHANGTYRIVEVFEDGRFHVKNTEAPFDSTILSE